MAVFNNLAISLLLIYPENIMPTIHILNLLPQISPFPFPVQQSYNTSKISLPTAKKKLLLFANQKKYSRDKLEKNEAGSIQGMGRLWWKAQRKDKPSLNISFCLPLTSRSSTHSKSKIKSTKMGGGTQNNSDNGNNFKKLTLETSGNKWIQLHN